MHKVRAISGKLKSKICLDRGIELGRAAEVDVPAPIRQLTPPNVIGELTNALGISLIENVQIKNVVRFECGIGLKLP